MKMGELLFFIPLGRSMLAYEITLHICQLRFENTLSGSVIRRRSNGRCSEWGSHQANLNHSFVFLFHSLVWAIVVPSSWCLILSFPFSSFGSRLSSRLRVCVKHLLFQCVYLWFIIFSRSRCSMFNVQCSGLNHMNVR